MRPIATSWSAYVSVCLLVMFGSPAKTPKIPLPVGMSSIDPNLIHGSLGLRQSVPPKRHLDRFSRFCRSHERDKQTDHATPSSATASSYRVWCGITSLILWYDDGVVASCWFTALKWLFDHCKAKRIVTIMLVKFWHLMYIKSGDDSHRHR